MQPRISAEQLSDQDLLDAVQRIVGDERQLTAQFIALIAEVDARQLYLGQSCSSLFTYCTEVLHLSEHAAYCRIAAARCARRLPLVLKMLADGDVTLTTIKLIGPHLTEDNHEALLASVRHKSKRYVEELVAALDPQPDVASRIRKLRCEVPTPALPMDSANSDAESSSVSANPAGVASRMPPVRPRATVAPLAPARYLMKITVGGETHAKLEHARDLLRYVIPSGDPAAIVDRALTALIAELERTKQAKVRRPRTNAVRRSSGRHVPAGVRRDVWARDNGRCAFVGRNGRCTETGFLELHHVVPFAEGGPTTVDNLQLRCRSHNAYEAERWFGGATPSGPDRVEQAVRIRCSQ